MESISVFEIIKIGIGPSSSHTMGPWKAAAQFASYLKEQNAKISRIRIHLFGSLAKTGIGHGTDIAVLLGLSGYDYVTVDTSGINEIVHDIHANQYLNLPFGSPVAFNAEHDILLHADETLKFHPNGIRFEAKLENGESLTETYYSIGGGFVIKDGEKAHADNPVQTPYQCDTEGHVLENCRKLDLSISELILLNETAWRSKKETRKHALQIWEEIKACIFRGISRSGILPGGLNVRRRAYGMNKKLLEGRTFKQVNEWIQAIKEGPHDFKTVNKWVSIFALAVSEENAAFGRIVTAPTNGASGVIPAVLLYAYCFIPDFDEEAIIKFILTAGEIGTLYKKGATISAAMGGCQAEIGVSSSMAAGGLVEAMGGTLEQVFQAAEIAMEHHLGLTCDPIGGLVQLPCIERNSMGAIKAITAAHMTLEGDSSVAKVSLDDVIKAMWETAQDMHSKYKETSEGGLANIAVNIVEC